MSRKKYRGLPMASILILTIAVLVIAVVAGTVVLSLDTYREAVIRSAQTSSRQAVDQATNTVSSYVQAMDGVMELVQHTLSREDQDPDVFLRDLLRIQPDVTAVTTYSPQGELEQCWALGHRVREKIVENLSFDREKIGEGPWPQVSAPHVASIFENWYPWVVTMTVPKEPDAAGGWISLDLSFDGIANYMNNVGIGQHGYCFIMDEDGEIIYHPQQQLIYSHLKQEDTSSLVGRKDGVYTQEHLIYAIHTVRSSTWRVVGVSSVEELINDNVKGTTEAVLLVALVVLLTAFLLSVVLSKALSRPLRALSGDMQAFERNAGTFVHTPVGGAREVRELSDSFGHMVRKVQELMETVRLEEINLRKTELRALQAQINPHFLYNTLDSIAWMCEQGRTAEAVQMVNALARLFRISISRGHELIPIRAELQHAESYLQIQKHRYKDQFTYKFQVDESLLDCLCNKITLQPMIENAIYHGINGLVDEGEILITMRGDGEDIVFTVEDNGVGMEQEQIEAILQKERSDRAGIGIKNVNDRLKIYFGEKYGITIESVPDEGTVVTIRMPQVREEGPYEHR